MAIWNIKQVDAQLLDNLRRAFRVPEIIARVLANRGIHSVGDSERFFSPSLDLLHDPFLMLGMETAAREVARQITEQGKILVLSDYDVDGTTGASMIYLFLKALGASPSVYIPDRETEGYGLSHRGIDFAVEQEADLLITCDCGINAVGEVDYANHKGIRVIITDHHTPGTDLPEALCILNPKQEGCSYPFKNLCGGGVAFKLISGVAQMLNVDPLHATRHLDLVTLGTAADIVPIVDENRIMVSHGLRLMEKTDKPGLLALLEVCGLADRELTVGKLVFWVGPKINAAGRMGDATRAVRLLTSDNFFESVEMARELDEENRSRQAVQQAIVSEAILKTNAEVDLEIDRAIVLWKDGWHPGIIGIVSSKIKEEYHRPAVIIAMDGKTGKGSARSIPGFDLYENLAKCSEYLDDFGGHPMAAGLNIQVGNLEEFRRAFVRLANGVLSEENMIPSLWIEGEMGLDAIDGRFIDFLKKLSPYGPGNVRPQFVSRRIQIAGSPRLVGDGNHLKFTAKQNGIRFDAIGFNLAKHYQRVITGEPIDIVYVVEENEWQGQKSIQLNITDIKKTREKTP